MYFEKETEMRLSENAQTALSMIGVVVAVMLFYGGIAAGGQGLGAAHLNTACQAKFAQAGQPVAECLAKSVERSTQTATPSVSEPTKNPALATVGLPPRQRFMYIIPADEARRMRLGRLERGEIYVTFEVHGLYAGDTSSGPARLIRFLQAGQTPGSWEEVLYIQER